MMTASASPEHVIAAKNAGADDFIKKPFNTRALKEKISRIFAVHGSREAGAYAVAVD